MTSGFVFVTHVMIIAWYKNISHTLFFVCTSIYFRMCKSYLAKTSVHRNWFKRSAPSIQTVNFLFEVYGELSTRYVWKNILAFVLPYNLSSYIYCALSFANTIVVCKSGRRFITHVGTYIYVWQQKSAAKRQRRPQSAHQSARQQSAADSLLRMIRKLPCVV